MGVVTRFGVRTRPGALLSEATKSVTPTDLSVGEEGKDKVHGGALRQTSELPLEESTSHIDHLWDPFGRGV